MVPTRPTHPFWMYEEMQATPAALDHALAPSAAERSAREELATRLATARRVYLTGCGTAYHAALVGAAFLRDFTAGQVDARAVQSFELAHYAQPGPGANDLLIALSHSGKPTATNAALARAHGAGAYCLTITGNPTSPAAQLAQAVIEYGYAEAKSFTYTISYSLMLAVLADLAAHTATHIHGAGPSALALAAPVRELARWHREALALEPQIEPLALRLAQHPRWIFAGAGGNYATALEAALKMQETNYTASFGMEMEEVLHGPVAALGDAVLVVIAPPGAARTRALDLLRAARLLGSETIALGATGDTELAGAAGTLIPLPTGPEALSPAPYHVPLHMLSYWVAVARGTNPDLMRREHAPYLDARHAYTL
ncbi:MAG: Glucosamine--fructose-6-phosphate aminotransferase [isomerizing] [Ktedonobacterales bacterium]|jgi:glucosamine 6-phosphate synthetase-like amidotransferase/phosphosugar isomerase protein|nr:MAG: Glucosamine--fructose-6-phosphate aminotransferase [isomerizing] [Ktedonobacterales bacterium]